MTKIEYSIKFESAVMRRIIGILGQYGKPLSELSELQRCTFEEDVFSLSRGLIKEAENAVLDSLKAQKKGIRR